MENRFWRLLELLEDQNYRTAADLGRELKLSEKTVRTLIKEINAVIRSNGAEIESKQKYGYRLMIEEETRWIDFLSRSHKDPEQVPVSADERMYYLLNYLLSHKEYVKLADLGDRIYISAQTLSSVMKRVEEVFSPYHIRIERKPYYGIRAEGSEFDMRCCLIRCFSLDGDMFRRNFPVKEEALGRVFNLLMSILPVHQIRLTEISLQNLAIYIYLSYMRRQQGFCILEAPEKEREVLKSLEFKAAADIWSELLVQEELKATDPEICYTAIYIAGKRNVGSNYKTNFIITEKTDCLTMKMLSSIYQTYQIELRDNLNLRMMLNQHLQPLDIRLRYGIPAENPILQNVKRDYFMAYTMAAQAAVVLHEHYNREIPETEIGWLALIFQMAIEENAIHTKLNVLIVCASGKASSHLLLNKIRREFSGYISQIDVCTTYELGERRLEGVDYIFSTVPVPVSVNVPILQIHDFIMNYELKSIKKVFQSRNMEFLQEFYQKRFFFTDIEGDSREEVLLRICERLNEVTELPEGFYESVLKRESLGATDYGNRTAIPHPYEVMTEENVIAVTVLKRPVRWSANFVQLVVLVAFSLEENSNIPRFYDVTTRFMTDEEAVLEFLAKPSYEHLMELLYQMDGGEQD